LKVKDDSSLETPPVTWWKKHFSTKEKLEEANRIPDILAAS
jgi:hypothetical protein